MEEDISQRNKLSTLLSTLVTTLSNEESVSTNQFMLTPFIQHIESLLSHINNLKLESMTSFKNCLIVPEKGIYPDLQHPKYSTIYSLVPVEFDTIIYYSIPTRFQNAIMFLQIDYLTQLISELRYEELIHCMNQFQSYFQGANVNQKNIFHELARGYFPHLQLKDICYKKGFIQIIKLLLSNLYPKDIYQYLSCQDFIHRTPISIAISYKKPLILQLLLSYCPELEISCYTFNRMSSLTNNELYTQQLNYIVSYHLGNQYLSIIRRSYLLYLCCYRNTRISKDNLQQITSYLFPCKKQIYQQFNNRLFN